ncbi:MULTISPECIES: hypothetical protein [Bacteroides]|uniref:hypothetical protein n=1 Tax=Bacteroides TaxID=816 RepID=UPI00319E6167
MKINKYSDSLAYPIVSRLVKGKEKLYLSEKAISNSTSSSFTIADMALDNDYGTRWKADENDKNPSQTVSFKE